MREKDFRFTLDEGAGALGDLGTILPIVIGVSVATDMDLSRMLFFFGIAYIATGLYFKLPMPVEPMKAMGVVAIAEKLSPGEIAGAGIVMGLILIIIAATGAMDLLKRNIPIPLIRGIQFGLSITLVWQAIKMVVQDPVVGILSVGIILAYSFSKRLDISALIVIVLGVGVGLYRFGAPDVSFLSLPSFILPNATELLSGFTKATIPQIPLTLGNAVLATSLLIMDLLDRKVEENTLLYSMGAMCLLAVPFGGFPMCHGAGGLAAQYRFGARTGGSNLISGTVLLAVTLFFATPDLETLIPFGALGALLFYAGLSLFKTSLKTTDRVYTWATGVVAFALGMSYAFVGMWLFHFVRQGWRNRNRTS